MGCQTVTCWVLQNERGLSQSMLRSNKLEQLLSACGETRGCLYLGWASETAEAWCFSSRGINTVLSAGWEEGLGSVIKQAFGLIGMID